MAQHRIHNYMDKHRITPLFEELMNKVLHDQPEDPLVYLIRVLYKKAGLPIPADIKSGVVRRSSPERLARRSKSPEPGHKGTTQAWAIGSGPDLVDRTYDKPWQSGSKRLKPKKSEELSPPKPAPRKSKKPPKHSRSQTAPGLASDPTTVTAQSAPVLAKGRQASLEDFLQVTPKPLTPRRKHKGEWNPDNKVTAISFDDLFDENQKPTEVQKSHKVKETTDSRKAWASIGLGEGKENSYESGKYSGPRSRRNDDDPLAGEIPLASGDTQEEEETTATTQSTGHIRGPKLEASKHRRELEQLLTETDQASTDSGYIDDLNANEDDDAIELLEDPEDLRREGVTKISKTGYKLSRALRQRSEEPNVKLNIKVFESADQYGELSYYESDQERPATGMSSARYSQYSPEESEEEEFESVSQVTGPRRPVWNVIDSDGESYQPKMSRTLPQPSHKSKVSNKPLPAPSNKKLAATAPVRFQDPFSNKSVDSDNTFLQGGKPWTAGVYASEEQEGSPSSPVQGGWQLPDDSDASLATTDWTTGKSGGRRNQPPKRGDQGQGHHIPTLLPVGETRRRDTIVMVLF